MITHTHTHAAVLTSADFHCCFEETVVAIERKVLLL